MNGLFANTKKMMTQKKKIVKAIIIIFQTKVIKTKPSVFSFNIPFMLDLLKLFFCYFSSPPPTTKTPLRKKKKKKKMSGDQEEKMLYACKAGRVREVEQLLKEAPILLNATLDWVSFFFVFCFLFFVILIPKFCSFCLFL